MTFEKNKIVTVSIAVFLMISMLASMMLMPTSNAHTPAWQLPTYMYVSVAPNPIGVGQTVFVNLWLNCPPPTANAQYGDRWHNMTVLVTAPDGIKQTLGPFSSDSSGGTSTTFTPATIGNYTLQSFFGGQTLAGDNPAPPLFPGQPPNSAIGDYYQPSQSSTYTLTVQSDPITNSPLTPLPTGYWTRPINALNNNWYTVAGNWLGFGMGVYGGLYNATGNYNPYTTAPTSSHVLWTKPEAFGGTIGGEFGGSQQSNYYSTAQYEVKFQPIIMNDILYYTTYPGSTTYPTSWVAVNLHTGETIWTNDATNYGGGSPTHTALTSSGLVTTLVNGQIFNYVSPNQYGALAYLWSGGVPAGVTTAPGTTAYNMFDAMSGKYILSVVNVPSGLTGGVAMTVTEDQNGALIGYYINSTNPAAPTLVAWNSTKAIFQYGLDTGLVMPAFPVNNLWTWRPPQGAQIPFSDGIQWTMPIANNILGAPISLSFSGIASGVILMHQYGNTGGMLDAFQSGYIIEAGYSADTGQLLWGPVNRTEPANTRVSFGSTGNGNTGSAIGDGVWVECNLNTYEITGYSLFTGTKIWGPITLPNANPWTSLGLSQIVANGSIYIWTYGGDVYSINIHTGTINWQYHTPSGGVDSPYGVEPLWTAGGRGVVAGGLLFLAEGHEFAPPLFHGAKILALNLTDGTVVWSMKAFDVNGAKAISDGILTTLNAYDNQIYGYGKGPSSITLNAPAVGVTTTTPITISGTITDISAGSKQEAVAANFPNGLPCVSDPSMSQFMEAVYEQQTMPNNITGVPITLSVIDSNGNYRTIGTTTSDASGTFAFNWTPDISGAYSVYATFAGSESYFSSNAAAHFYASEPAATPAPTQAPIQSMADQYFIPAIAGLFAAIIIVGALMTILILRKRP
jgi:outer membrane protein assembly factor BamB